MSRKAKKSYPLNRSSFYSIETTGVGYEVFLNGNPVERCVAADTRRGYVVVASGPLTYGLNGIIKTHKLRGKVKVKRLAR